MSIIAEVSAIVEAANLVAKIGRLSLEFKNFVGLRLGVLREIAHWKDTLEELLMFARDANKKQSDNKLAWEWLKDLTSLCLDIDDVMTDLECESMRREARSNIFMKYCKSNSIKAWQFDNLMKKRIEILNARLREKIDTAGNAGLMALPTSEQGSASQASDLRNSGALIGKPILFGHEQEKESIIYELLSYNDGDPEIGVIAIVGMGGIGKTTVARDVYNDIRVNKFFDNIWLFRVSRDYNKSVMRGLLNCVAIIPFQNFSESGVLNELMEELKGKRFLIILDDLWLMKKPDWEQLMAAFRRGNAGSKVIVTTRSEDVADMARTGPKYTKLQPVPFDDCWKLFCSKVGVSPNGELEARKENAGKEIVSSCKGVTFAVAMYGGILRNKEQLQYWENVRDKNLLIWKEGHADIKSVMRLSYNNLSENLKRKFALLSLFPENHTYSTTAMTNQWRADALVKECVIGEEIVNELVASSLLTEWNNSYIMHHMMRELACEVAGKTCCVVEDDSITKTQEMFEKDNTRHVYFSGNLYSYAKMVENIKDSSILRSLTLYISPDSEYPDLNISLECPSLQSYQNSIILPNFGNLNKLRILTLNLYSNLLNLTLIQDLGNLKKLKILALYSSGISNLPNSITLLKNLEELYIMNGIKLKYLPSKIGNLKKLKTLQLNDTEISNLPDSITLLENLEELKLFENRKLEELPSNIGNLKKLKMLHLYGSKISNLTNSITLLENLEELKLFENRELKNLPSNIGKLNKLKTLHFNGTKIEISKNCK